MTKSQGAFEVAVQEQSGKLVVTFTVPLNPVARAEICWILTEKIHGVPACETATIWPATGMRALRFPDKGFAEAVRLIVPLPVPLVPLVTLIQFTVENANHGQLFMAAITLMLSDPPPVGALSCAGTAEYMQPTVEAEGTNSLTSLVKAPP